MDGQSAHNGDVLDTGVRTDDTFRIETHGIDTIPTSDRHGSPRELFWVWLGANLIFTYVIVGAVVVSFGLGFWTAVAVCVIGNLFYLLLGLGALAGPTSGTSTMVISRSAFGVFGNAPVAFLSWITVVGWQAVNIVIGTLVLYELALSAGLPVGTLTKAVCLVLIMMVTYLVAIWGHATIVFLNTVLAIALAVGTIGLGIYVIPQVETSSIGIGGVGVGPILLALMIVAAAPFSWMNYPADYSRYLPVDTSRRGIVWFTALGAFIPAVLITVVGIGAGTVTDMSDPFVGIAALVPAWFLTIYSIVIVLGTITNNFLNCYTSGLNIQAMGIRIVRYRAVLIDAAIALVMSIYAIFVFDFTESFTQFLSLMVIWIAPWTAIHLTDVWLRHNRFDAPALHARSGPYWYRDGWNWPAIGAFAAGIIAAALFANAPIWQGPLVGLVGDGDISILAGFLVAGAAYYAVMRPVLRPAVEPAPAPTEGLSG